MTWNFHRLITADKEARTVNSTFAIGGLSRSTDSFLWLQKVQSSERTFHAQAGQVVVKSAVHRK